MGKVDERFVGKTFFRKMPKVQQKDMGFLPPAAFSLPTCRQFSPNPEEEVFSISLESPVARLSHSYDWLYNYQQKDLLTAYHSGSRSASTSASAKELESEIH